MSGYAIIWTADAMRVLLGVDREMLRAIIAGGDRLAAAPARLSRPGVEENWPYYGQEQRYTFDVGDRRVSLLFQYAADEQHLHITDVSVLPRPR